MKLADLTSPGTIPNSQKLRVELLKAINYVQLEGMKRGHGSTHVATLSASLAAAKAAVDALAAAGDVPRLRRCWSRRDCRGSVRHNCASDR